MLKILFTIKLTLAFSIAFSQHYTQVEIRKKADSILLEKVGQRILNTYYSFDSLSYYEYTTKKGKTKWRTLSKDNVTKGNFVSMRVRYDFCLKDFKICRTTYIEFNSKLDLKDTINIDFIPQYILNNTECNFITKTKAIDIAESKFSRNRIKPISAGLTYDYHKKIYVWRVDNILTQKVDDFGDNYGELELIDIDALSGRILSFSPNAVYGAVR